MVDNPGPSKISWLRHWICVHTFNIWLDLVITSFSILGDGDGLKQVTDV